MIETIVFVLVKAISEEETHIFSNYCQEYEILGSPLRGYRDTAWLS